MGWEYRIHRFPRKGWIYRKTDLAEESLNIYGRRGWTLVSISDADGIAVFRRPAELNQEEAAGNDVRSSLVAELQELTHAIEELNQAVK